MARMLSDNRVKLVTSTKPNASAVFAGLNGSAPAGGYINPEAIHDPTTGIIIATGDTIPYCAYVDNLFECGIGTIDTSAHTLTRAAAVISNSAGTQVRLDFSGAATNPTIICSWDAIMGQSTFNLLRNQIYGLNLTYTSASAFGAGPGCAWIEGLNGAPLAASAPANLTGQTGTAANFYNVYEFLSSGVVTLEKVIGGVAGSTNPPVAFAVPAGSARSKTGDTSRRYLGTILYGATDTIRPFRCTDIGGGVAEMVYLNDTGGAAPFALTLGSSGGATSLTAVDISTLVPNNGTALEILVQIAATSVVGTNCNVSYSLDGTGFLAAHANPTITASTGNGTMWRPINPDTTTAFYYKVNSASAPTGMFCWAYRYRR